MSAALAICHIVMDVTHSREKVKLIDHYQETAEMVFEKFFETEPAAKRLFRFTRNEDLTENSKFIIHAMAIVDMIDCAVAFEGSDVELLKEELAFLKREHFANGVRGKYLAKMEMAVIDVVLHILENKRPRLDRNSWQEQSFYL